MVVNGWWMLSTSACQAASAERLVLETRVEVVRDFQKENMRTTVKISEDQFSRGRKWLKISQDDENDRVPSKKR